MDPLYFVIPKNDPHLLRLRGERARLEAGESVARVFPSSPRPDVTATCTVIYLAHVERGENEVLVAQIGLEATEYLKARGGKFSGR